MVPRLAAGIMNFGKMITIALVVVLAISIKSASADSGSLVTVEGNLLRVETRTLKAVLDRGLIISLVRKSDGRELVAAYLSWRGGSIPGRWNRRPVQMPSNQ